MKACLALTGIVTMIIPFTVDYSSFTGALIAYGLTLGLSGPMAAWMSDLVPRDRLGPAMGLFRTVNDAGFVAGPLLLGSVADLTCGGGRISYLPFIHEETTGFSRW